MRPERAAGKIILDMLDLGIIKEDDQETVYRFLIFAYGAGFDEGRSQNRKRKPVMQCDHTTGKPIKLFDSITEASKRTKIPYSTITEALSPRKRTGGGYIWKFINKEDYGKSANSSKSDGTGH